MFGGLTCQSGAGAKLGRTLWGMPTLGAFGFQLQEVAGDRRIVTTTRSHSNKVVTDCVDAMEPHEVVRVGGAGNKVRQADAKLWTANWKSREDLRNLVLAFEHFFLLLGYEVHPPDLAA